MPLLPNQIARRENGRLELRTGPVRLRWNLDDLVAADGHRLHCTFTCSVIALSDPAEWKMLEEAFLSRATGVTTDDVVKHFAPAMRSAASKVAREHKAEAWTKGDPAAVSALTDALRDEAKKVAFMCGLEVVAPFNVQLDSPSFQAQQIEEMERTLAERRVAGQVEHFERAGKLLRQFEELRKAAPDLTPADILRQVSPAEQGMMLQTLLLASGKAGGTNVIWAVAGTSVVRIDPRAKPPAVVESIPMPMSVGPLRSVQKARVAGRDVLLVGGRNGIVAFDPEAGEKTEYIDRAIDSQLGFSSAVVWNDQIWGCHGDAGVVSWRISEGGAPSATIRPAELRPAGMLSAAEPPPLPRMASVMATGVVQSMAVRGVAGIRNLTVIDERRLALSVGHTLTVIDREGQRSQIPLESPAEILAIVPDGGRVAVVQEDGTVSVRDRQSLSAITSHRRAGRLTAAAVLPWLGSRRLLLATDEGPVYCVGIEDEVVTQFTSAHRGLRVVSAAADIIAAISPDRQRIVLWNSWEGKRPLAEVLVAAVTRHRAGDIEVG